MGRYVGVETINVIMSMRKVAEAIIENGGPMTPEEVAIEYNTDNYIGAAYTIMPGEFKECMDVSERLTPDDSGRYHIAEPDADIIERGKGDA